jgi:hypothetical protein
MGKGIALMVDMRLYRGQWANEWSSATTARPLGQGATEYLVLLAVVLIVALVSVALLGFFPGMASDAQAAQSKTYWQSASPIAIVETGALWYPDCSGRNYTHIYLRVRNTGVYTITITKMLVGNNSIASVATGGWGPSAAMSARLASGEETFFAYYYIFPGIPDLGSGNRSFVMFAQSGSSGNAYTFPYGSAASLCELNSPYGSLVANDFGFEYVQNVEGQTVTKREIGKPLVIKCSPGRATC